MKLSRYKLTLLFNAFPAYSPSAMFTSIFVQPRWFSLPLLITGNINIRWNKWKLLLVLNIIICLTVPIIGIFYNREFSLMDIAYMISSIYALAFLSVTVENIGIFNKYLTYFVLANFTYVIVQISLYYLNYPELTMIHSNIPFQSITQYDIQPGLLFGFPRYTGLFVESGPFAFYLCLTFLYIIQQGVRSSGSIKTIVIVMILFSQSKFLLAFLPILFFEKIFSSAFPRIYIIITRPISMLLLRFSTIIIMISIIFTDFEIIDYFSKTIPAFELRLEGIRYSLSSLVDLDPFGKGLLPSNIEVQDSIYELAGLDAFSIVIFGYGLYMGAAMIIALVLFPILASIKYKYSFITVLLMGLLSSGSLLIPQYMFAIIYSVLAHYQNRSYLFSQRVINCAKYCSQIKAIFLYYNSMF